MSASSRNSRIFCENSGQIGQREHPDCDQRFMGSGPIAGLIRRKRDRSIEGHKHCGGQPASASRCLQMAVDLLVVVELLNFAVEQRALLHRLDASLPSRRCASPAWRGRSLRQLRRPRPARSRRPAATFPQSRRARRTSSVAPFGKDREDARPQQRHRRRVMRPGCQSRPRAPARRPDRRRRKT